MMDRVDDYGIAFKSYKGIGKLFADFTKLKEGKLCWWFKWSENLGVFKMKNFVKFLSSWRTPNLQNLGIFPGKDGKALNWPSSNSKLEMHGADIIDSDSGVYISGGKEKLIEKCFVCAENHWSTHTKSRNLFWIGQMLTRPRTVWDFQYIQKEKCLQAWAPFENIIPSSCFIYGAEPPLYLGPCALMLSWPVPRSLGGQKNDFFVHTDCTLFLPYRCPSFFE